MSAGATKNHLVHEGNTIGNYYLWKATTSGAKISTPSTAGWEIDKNSSCRINRGNWIIPKGSHSAMFQVSATSNPVMGASGIATASATLNLPRYSVAQWRKRTDIANQTGRSRGTAATESLNNLTEADSYTYKAYSKDSCNGADEIATVTFSTTTTNQN